MITPSLYPPAMTTRTCIATPERFSTTSLPSRATRSTFKAYHPQRLAMFTPALANSSFGSVSKGGAEGLHA